jgi:hypothetical protein
MDKLEFYDIRSKTKFPSTDWRIESRSTGNRTRYFAVAPFPHDPEKRESWRIVSKDFADKNMKDIEVEEETQEEVTPDEETNHCDTCTCGSSPDRDSG